MFQPDEMKSCKKKATGQMRRESAGMAVPVYICQTLLLQAKQFLTAILFKNSFNFLKILLNFA